MLNVYLNVTCCPFRTMDIIYCAVPIFFIFPDFIVYFLNLPRSDRKVKFPTINVDLSVSLCRSVNIYFIYFEAGCVINCTQI